MPSIDLVWTGVAFVLTLLVFSYLLGDNPLFRIVSYLFVGVTAGYTAVLLVDQVLIPRVFLPLIFGTTPERLLLVVPLVLGILLALRSFPRLDKVTTVPLGYLVGAGAAVMVGGAVTGTLFGQINGAANVFDFQVGTVMTRNPLVQLVEGIILTLGTITTLTYFQFGARVKTGQPVQRAGLVEALARIGQFFLAVTLGALFAGVFAAALTALIDRLDFIVDTIFKWIA